MRSPLPRRIFPNITIKTRLLVSPPHQPRPRHVMTINTLNKKKKKEEGKS